MTPGNCAPGLRDGLHREVRIVASRKRPKSAKASIRASLVGILLAVSATALTAHEFLRREDAHAAAHARTRLLAETMALEFDAIGPSAMDDAQHVCQTMLESPSLLAICIWDGSGRQIACAGRKAEHAQMLDLVRSRPEKQKGADSHFWLAHAFSSDAGPLDAQFVPIGVGAVGRQPATLGVLLDMSPMLGGFWEHFVLYYLPVIGAGGLAMLYGVTRLHRDVLHPLGSLVQAASSDTQNRGDTTEFDSHEELGVLARAVHALKLDAVTWRRKAELTERRSDTRVAVETRRITRDLHRIQQAAWKDQLTDIYNRRFMDEKLPGVFDAQRLANRDLSIVMFDLDNFKLLNDTEGHAAGDAVLKFVGELLRQHTRHGDFAVRYGGDEFLLVMPGLPAAKAMVVADRILAHFVQRAKMMVRVRPAPSLSAGVASIVNNRPSSLGDAIEMADEVLLSAKQAGKACVHLAMRRGDKSRPLRLARTA